jgi:hypothetical protein
MHKRHPLAMTAVLIAGLSFGASGCNRGDRSTPVAESQTTTPERATNQPMTVAGCLRAGEAAETYVLTTSGTDTATYNLVGDEAVNLRDHVGKQVTVEGILTAQEETATRAAAPAADRATGTSGTPTVETRTAVDIRRLEVRAVRPTTDDCK